MSRRNSDRIGGRRQSTASPPAQPAPMEGFSFVVPTEFVELPSQGRYYPEDHPLHGQSTIEIKQMTAKEEDILTSRTLIQKGLALDRLISSLIVDKRINTETLLVGDRSAIIIAARISGYGPEYETKIQCPSCQTEQKFNFDIRDPNIHHGGEIQREDITIIEKENGIFETVLPNTKIKVSFRLLTGKEEKQLLEETEKDRKRKREKNITRIHKIMITAVNDSELLEHRNHVIENLPSLDSRYLRSAYRIATPNVDLIKDFECSECGRESELEVPLTADFFWPDT